MKKISKTSIDIFLFILSKLNQEGYAKLDSGGGYMPLVVERISVAFRGTENELQQISFAHYGELNGDLMADPEMVFIYYPNSKIVIPFYYKQDYLGIEENCVFFDEDGKPNRFLEKKQREQTEFADLWLGNIKEQQNLTL